MVKSVKKVPIWLGRKNRTVESGKILRIACLEVLLILRWNWVVG